jgi:hypothetical protein
VKYFLEMYVSEKKQKEYLILLHNYLSKYLWFFKNKNITNQLQINII